MKLHLRIIEADNIPKMDLIGKADPYCIATLSESHDSDKTEYIDETYTPRWDKVMTLNVATIAESVLFEIKDHDKVGRDDLIGSYKKNIKKFPPGIVTDEWIQLEAAKGVKKAARLHVVSHLALDGMPPFCNMPFQFLKVVVKVISARDIAKMDTFGKTDPYVLVYLRNYPNVKYKTKVMNNNMEPKWDQDFELDLLNQTNDILTLTMMDKDVAIDDEMANLDIPLGQFGLFEIVEREYDMKPYKKVKKGGKILVRIQILPLGERAWTTGPIAFQCPVPPQDPQYQQMMMQQMQAMQNMLPGASTQPPK